LATLSNGALTTGEISSGVGRLGKTGANVTTEGTVAGNSGTSTGGGKTKG
jgi:hypothetical protein